jgi:hypothetical protein
VPKNNHFTFKQCCKENITIRVNNAYGTQQAKQQAKQQMITTEMGAISSPQ